MCTQMFLRYSCSDVSLYAKGKIKRNNHSAEHIYLVVTIALVWRQTSIFLQLYFCISSTMLVVDMLTVN